MRTHSRGKTRTDGRERLLVTAVAAALLLARSGPGECQTGWHRVKPPAAFGVNPMFDARWVHDLYILSGALTSASDKTHLVFCDVSPDPWSGIDQTIRCWDPKTQTFSIIGKGLGILDFGAYRLLGGFGCSPGFKTGTFQWKPPIDYHWGFEYLFDSDPFEWGGVVAFPLPDKPRLLAHPDPMYSIAPGYVGVLQDELAFWRAHPSWTEALGTEAGLAFAQEQLKSGNPLVVMEATRALAAAGKLDRETAALLVNDGPEIRQAREVLAILSGMTVSEKANLGQVVLDAIDRAKSSEELKGLAIATITAYSIAWYQEWFNEFHSTATSCHPATPLSGTGPFIESMYTHVVDRQRGMHTHTPADSYIQSLDRGDDWAYWQAGDDRGRSP